MVEKRTLAEVIALLVLLPATFYGGVTVDTLKNYHDAYYCKASNSIMPTCDSLSAYYSLPNGKCVNKAIGNKLCKSGWEKIEAPIEVTIPKAEGQKEYKCPPNLEPCVEVN